MGDPVFDEWEGENVILSIFGSGGDIRSESGFVKIARNGALVLSRKGGIPIMVEYHQIEHISADPSLIKPRKKCPKITLENIRQHMVDYHDTNMYLEESARALIRLHERRYQ